MAFILDTMISMVNSEEGIFHDDIITKPGTPSSQMCNQTTLTSLVLITMVKGQRLAHKPELLHYLSCS
jgi:hypothetical protein